MARGDFWVRLGDDELMLDRNHRNVEVDHGAGLAGEVSARRYNMLACYFAVISGNAPFAARAAFNGFDGDAAVDLSATLTRTSGQSLS